MAGNRKSNNNSGTGANGRAAGKKGKKQNNRGGNGGTGPPTAVGSRTIALGPAIARGPGQTATFSNVEYITDVASGSSAAGQIIGTAINPANSDFSPWLSRIAAGYELYRFRRLSVVYVPTCSTSTAGVVVLGVDYDTTDNPPQTKQQLSGYAGSVRGNVWSKLTLNVMPMDGWYYTGLTAASSGPAGTDQKFYDMGKLYYGVFNTVGGAQAIGELTVSYTIEFAKPEFTILPGLSERIVVNSSDATNMGGLTVDVTGNNVISLSSPAASTLRMTANSPGEYLLTLIGQYTPTIASMVNPFGSILQTDQTITGTAASTVTWSEQLVTGMTANVNTYFILVACVALKIGTTLSTVLVPNISSFRLIAVRASTYKKSLG
uniref:Capsid protein n=1 Tax=Riboviria sp. TaxID=2585031 RepID=A0A514D099_9VIRU|nr:MAG: hypothetical protein H1Bulk30269_000001 [Riboviria sp.]